jgi:putative ATPase
MVILASEDIGLADNHALGIATDAFHAIELIGLPEGAYALSHAAVYLAIAPKSNTITQAMAATRELIERSASAPVPAHLRSAASTGQRALGDGVDYQYPHRDPSGILPQQYLPDGVKQEILFRPGSRGDEDALRERLEQIDARLGKRVRK